MVELVVEVVKWSGYSSSSNQRGVVGVVRQPFTQQKICECCVLGWWSSRSRTAVLSLRKWVIFNSALGIVAMYLRSN